MADVFQGAAASLIVDGKLVELRHGDEIPDGVDNDTLQSLRDAGAFNEPVSPDDPFLTYAAMHEDAVSAEQLGMVADPEHDLAPAATPESEKGLSQLSRGELDELASSLGVDDPEGLANKDAVIAAISERQGS